MTKLLKPDILATVRLLSTREGGRHSPTPTNFLGCLFEIAGEYFDCRLLLESVGSLLPGDQVQIPIKFLSPQLFKDQLQIGQEFNLCEGQRKIGEGKIEEILI